MRAFQRFAGRFDLAEPFNGSRGHQAALRKFHSDLVDRFINALEPLKNWRTGNPRVRIERDAWGEVLILKELTMRLVILHPSLALDQHGYKRILATLFEVFADDAMSRRPKLLPERVQEELKLAPRGEAGALRVVCDFIAGMSERKAVETFQSLRG